ncbi:MAG: WecB/TagA/CpsF family glycosyltransferase, partial [Staphylococcus equorum]
IEVFSGTKKRAPALFRRLNLEWVYRVIIDWKRLGRMKSIPRFIFKVIKETRKK